MKPQEVDYNIISQKILGLSSQFGFLEASIAKIKIDQDTSNKFQEWLRNNFHGEMKYLERNTELRFNPELLHDNTLSIICVKIPYLKNSITNHKQRLSSDNAYVSSYALGRDYHKVVKQHLNAYAKAINTYLKEFNLEQNYRAFTDSAPILEVELAQNSGLGWRGKNTLLLNKNEGSMFFLGEIFTNLPLIASEDITHNHCGSCKKCLDICPTNAFVSPYVLDAKRCISYLTIENNGPIPIEFRKAIGNRIYGCDDCQIFCPWNKFSKVTTINDFNVRNNLDTLSLIEAFSWDLKTWQEKMQGSAIYRIGYDNWLRNVAIALGNAKTSTLIINSLKSKLNYPNQMVQEHIKWALEQHNTNNQ